jgi:hypothetical protein
LGYIKNKEINITNNNNSTNLTNTNDNSTIISNNTINNNTIKDLDLINPEDDPIILEQLIILYKTVKKDWHNLVFKISNHICKNVFSQYNTREIIANKTMLREAFKQQLKKELIFRNITLINSNILRVKFPKEIKNAFEKIEILNQKSFQYAYRINSANIEIKNKINITNFEKNIIENEVKFFFLINNIIIIIILF